MTTVVSNGVTIVVPLASFPSLPTSTCATGWYLCGADAGPVPGCCPSGYTCGTASCTVISASTTGKIQKVLPSASLGDKLSPEKMAAYLTALAAALLFLQI
jgi:progranulin